MVPDESLTRRGVTVRVQPWSDFTRRAADLPDDHSRSQMTEFTIFQTFGEATGFIPEDARQQKTPSFRPLWCWH
jgi:hypothetical protein